MKRSRSVRVLACATALLALAACSGGEPDGPDDPDGGEPAAAVVTRDASRQGPAPDVDGATAGGTITVHLPEDEGPATLDPSASWQGSGRAIQQALTHRSLTQYARGEDGRPVLVPDLAVDLGRPNDDFTEWRFTIREDATWEDGKLITPREVAFGIKRSLDAKAFPLGPGTEYSARYLEGADKYRGPYRDADKKLRGVTVEGRDVVLRMTEPFPDMDHFGAFMAMGPAPEGKASVPPAYGRDPLSNGPYKVESFKAGRELVLVRNDQWNPGSDPARHQYVDKWVFRFDQDQAETDELLLSGSPESQTAISTALGQEHYERGLTELGNRLVHQPSPCVTTLVPDHRRITEVEVRRALAYAYPYEDAWLAAGEVPGATRVHAASILPYWTAGRRDLVLEGGPVRTDPELSKELLAAAGYRPGEYEITMIYYGADPIAREVQGEVTRGLKAGGFKVRAIPVAQSPYNVWTDPKDDINKQLNLRGVTLCADWPTGSALLPALVGSDSLYNVGRFADEEVDAEIERISTLPHEQQGAAWSELDHRLVSELSAVIPVDHRNELLAFGEKIGNPSGDAAIGAPHYKDLFVVR
ncbi:ABC transporter substrate-binding protein [Nocardioides solisilvae]|uniref:ABC transporter substrate-binding protein n=1 Tax=Nocardioides solisilvae TaxID=1542435 RepID=UPI0013A5567A|nr:ABC transporter substrate-binding protein [Nocardioides solisilvae]